MPARIIDKAELLAAYREMGGGAVPHAKCLAGVSARFDVSLSWVWHKLGSRHLVRILELEVENDALRQQLEGRQP